MNELCLSVMILTMVGVLSIMLLSARVADAVLVPPDNTSSGGAACYDHELCHDGCRSFDVLLVQVLGELVDEIEREKTVFMFQRMREEVRWMSSRDEAITRTIARVARETEKDVVREIQKE